MATVKSATAGSKSLTINKPAEPTIDEAAKNRDDLDMIRRRRGVLSNIYGGADTSGTAPTVGTKTLLGQ